MKKTIKNQYQPSNLELKWQSKWKNEGTYHSDLDSANPATNSGRTPFYNLMMFPYPSAEGLHIGGVRTFSGVDIYGRFMRMRGRDVFQPFGLDGFGIHAENYALKIGKHPMTHSKVTEENYYRQIREVALGVDWTRTVETYKKDYYKWTQWLFTELFKAGLAYRKKSPVNFCPSCKTVLADEQVIQRIKKQEARIKDKTDEVEISVGVCERCESIVEKKNLEQWFFKITKYADRLLDNINSLNWTEKVKIAQKNWIGKKEGINISYPVILGTQSEARRTRESLKAQKLDSGQARMTITVFTTRPDTNFGATFIALAPEHDLVQKILHEVGKDKKNEIVAYLEKVKNKSEIDRQAEGREKTGVFTGFYALNQLTAYKMPIWISDFVLMGFGTGAVVGVPGHDKRDFEFAQKFGLEIKRVVLGQDKDRSEITKIDQVQEEAGVMINSDFLDGMEILKAKDKIMDYIEEKGYGKKTATYHLRDWLISRQRYWGPPIPMIHCEKCAQKKPKIILVHGINGHKRENWFPWFKKTFEERGFEVIIPDMPDAEIEGIDKWVDTLEKQGIEQVDKIYIVAHSMGAPAAIKYIIKNKLKVEKLILVAPTGAAQGNKNWHKLGHKNSDIVRSFNNSLKEMDRIPDLVNSRLIYLSDNDPYIPLDMVDSYTKIKADIRVFKNKGHFNKSSGVVELPEILEDLGKVEDLNLGWYPVPEKDLPVELPFIKDFKPIGTGASPLGNHPEFYKVKCPKCGAGARLETDVSDTFLDSSWYFLRYLATDWDDLPFPSIELAKSDKQKAVSKKRAAFLPVHMYIGGAEHSVLHLLYARFITMFLKDRGYIDFEEPFARFYAHGMIIKDGAKMSKSKGNVVGPDMYIKKYGADTLRTYLHFLGPFDQTGDFKDEGIEGMNRFLKKVWRLLSDDNKQKAISNKQSSDESLKMMHRTIKNVTEEMENLRFNTAIAFLMTWYNYLAKQDQISYEEAEAYLKMLAPFAPHMTEELFQRIKKYELGNKDQGEFASIHTSPWPEFNEKYLVLDTIKIPVQVNGKLRGTLEVVREDVSDEAKIEELARADENVAKFLIGKTLKKAIYINGKVLNFVV